MSDVPDDDEREGEKKTPRATIIRRALVAALALACAGGWIYTRYLVKKETLGGECTYDIHCRAEAPRCMKQDVEGKGVCTRPCDNDGDCAADIKCIKVTLDDYDDRGRPLEGGYCFPQALLDARRKKKHDGGVGTAADATDGGPEPTGTWLTIPNAPDQLEATLTMERGTQKVDFEVKGTLLRILGGKKRVIFDTTTLRQYFVDDEKKQFSAGVVGLSTNTVKLTKTDKTGKVLDTACDIWTIEEGQSLREACVLKGGAFVAPGPHGIQSWEQELSIRHLFPLKITDGDKTKLQVTKLDIHPVDPAGFTIPKSFKNAPKLF